LEFYKEINSAAAEAIEVSEIEMPMKGA